MATTTAHVPTNHASLYLQQLCKHWSHKLDVAFTPTQGTVRFPEAVATLTAEAAALLVSIEAAEPAVLDRLKPVVASHLDRFAFREASLPFVWS